MSCPTPILFENQHFSTESEEFEHEPLSILAQLEKKESQDELSQFYSQSGPFETKNISSIQKLQRTYKFKKSICLVDHESGSQIHIQDVKIQIKKSPQSLTCEFQQILASIEEKIQIKLSSFMLFIKNPENNIYTHIPQISTQQIDFEAFKSMPLLTLRIHHPNQQNIEQENEKIQYDGQNNEKIQYDGQNNEKIQYDGQNNEKIKYDGQNNGKIQYDGQTYAHGIIELDISEQQKQEQQQIQEEKQLCELYKNCQKQQQQENKKRVRERSIQDVIDSVNEWRHLFENGIKDEKNPSYFRRLTLEESARIVGIQKKSLDNYHLQIKRGQKYGFDFHKNCDQKMGVLRKFNDKKIKEEKNNNNQLQKQSISQQNNNNTSSEIVQEQQLQQYSTENFNIHTDYNIQQNMEHIFGQQDSQQQQFLSSEEIENQDQFMNNFNNFEVFSEFNDNQNEWFVSQENNINQCIQENQTEFNKLQLFGTSVADQA